VESKSEKNVFSSLKAKENLTGVMMTSRNKIYVILLVGTRFIGTAPHFADGRGSLFKGHFVSQGRLQREL
jgi:hypothetical protein